MCTYTFYCWLHDCTTHWGKGSHGNKNSSNIHNCSFLKKPLRRVLTPILFMSCQKLSKTKTGDSNWDWVQFLPQPSTILGSSANYKISGGNKRTRRKGSHSLLHRGVKNSCKRSLSFTEEQVQDDWLGKSASNSPLGTRSLKIPQMWGLMKILKMNWNQVDNGLEHRLR